MSGDGDHVLVRLVHLLVHELLLGVVLGVHHAAHLLLLLLNWLLVMALELGELVLRLRLVRLERSLHLLLLLLLDGYVLLLWRWLLLHRLLRVLWCAAITVNEPTIEQFLRRLGSWRDQVNTA